MGNETSTEAAQAGPVNSTSHTKDPFDFGCGESDLGCCNQTDAHQKQHESRNEYRNFLQTKELINHGDHSNTVTLRNTTRGIVIARNNFTTTTIPSSTIQSASPPRQSKLSETEFRSIPDTTNPTSEGAIESILGATTPRGPAGNETLAEVRRSLDFSAATASPIPEFRSQSPRQYAGTELRRGVPSSRHGMGLYEPKNSPRFSEPKISPRFGNSSHLGQPPEQLKLRVTAQVQEISPDSPRFSSRGAIYPPNVEPLFDRPSNLVRQQPPPAPTRLYNY